MSLARSISKLLGTLSSGPLRAYLDILVVGSGARVFGLASQFVVLIMLSRFLPKQSFGDLMTAFGFYRLTGAALGIGGSLVLLFHVSRQGADRPAQNRLRPFFALGGGVAAQGPCARCGAGGATGRRRARQAVAGYLAATARAVRGLHHALDANDGRAG